MEQYDRLKAAEDVVKACWEKEAPFCSDACPFHFDIRDFLERLGRGSFNAAYRALYKGVGIPELTARLCPGYCREACARRECDQAIDLPRLEQAACSLAASTRPTSFNMPAKQGRFAVVGAGISGLGCALRLAQRKYQVTVFEQSGRIGGCLNELLEPAEAAAILEKAFTYEKYELRLNTPVRDLGPLLEEFDGVYVATGGGDAFGLTWQGELPAATDRPGCFVGGGLAGAEPIPALAQGLNAAPLLEAWLQTGVMRGQEQRRPTRMRLDPSALSYRPQAQVEGPYNKEQAAAEADRCIKCRCDSCRRHCPMLAYLDKMPLRLQDEVHITVFPGSLDHDGTVAQRLISTCNQCGLCGEVCPQHIDIGDYLRVAHQLMTPRKSFPWSFHEFWLRDMEHALSPHFALTAAPTQRPKYMYFPGCQAPASHPDYAVKGYARVRELEPDSGVWLSCCGAPAVWAGQEDRQQEIFADLTRTWEGLGRPTLLLACPTCLDMFSRYLPEIPAQLLSDFLWQRGAAPLRRLEGELAAFDPCPLRKRPEARQHIRELARSAGCTVSELPEHGAESQCCSFGGQIDDTDRRYAVGLAQTRAAASNLPYLVACTNCRDVLQREGKDCVHVLDLLLGLDRGPELADLEQRLSNREQARSELIRRFFPEREDDTAHPVLAVELACSEQVRAKLSAERIRLEDAAAVIAASEASGRVLEDRSSGVCVAHGPAGRSTVWVEYQASPDGGFRLLNAYGHRMTIESEEP